MNHSAQPRVVIPAESAGLKSIALFELSKGCLMLIVGWGILAFLHQDLQTVAIDIVHRLHLDPDGNLVGRVLLLLKRASGINLWLIAIGATFYAAIRVAEAYGLWYDRPWASWLGALSGAVYMPVEAYEVWEKLTVTRAAIFIGNALIVVFLCHRLWLRHRALQGAMAAIATGIEPEFESIKALRAEAIENPESTQHEL